MDKKGNNKKVSVKNIDKIIKFNEYENKVVTYKCGDEDIEIDVSPVINMEQWLVAIATGISLIDDDDYDNKYKLGVYSIALKLAIVVGFTNISRSIGNSKIVDFIQRTDISERVSSVLPKDVLLGFTSDFEKVYSTIKCRQDNEKVNRLSDVIVDSLEKLKDAMNNLSIDDYLLSDSGSDDGTNVEGEKDV